MDIAMPPAVDGVEATKRIRRKQREAGEHQDAGFPLLLADPLGRLDAVHDRHRDVHQDHVRLQRERLLDGLLAVAGAADDLDLRLGGQDRLERLGEETMVVGDQDANLAAWVAAPRGYNGLRRRSSRGPLEDLLDPLGLLAHVVLAPRPRARRVRAGHRGRRTQGVGHPLYVERVDEHAGLGRHELRRAAGAGGDHRAAAGHRLEHRLAERLDQARLADHMGARRSGPAARRAGRRRRARPARGPRAAARSGPSPTKVSVPSPSRAKASASRTTFLRSVSEPMQRKRGPPRPARARR